VQSGKVYNAFIDVIKQNLWVIQLTDGQINGWKEKLPEKLVV
jgi:hypothetical protein